MKLKTLKKNNHIIIIGGTSGIGLALAKSYLSGDFSESWQVTIVGSSFKKITKLENELLIKYPNSLNLYQCDISKTEKLEKLFIELEKTPFNQLVYSAGWYLNERKKSLSKSESNRMLAINLQAFNQVFHWVSNLLKKTDMTNKKIICIASVAGLLDYSQSSLYAKSKRAMIFTALAYREGLKPFDIDVICIASGYVDTAKLRYLNNGNAQHKPFIISEEEAVSEIHHAVDKNIALYCFPRQMKRVVSILGLFPKRFLNWAMKLQYRKQDAG